MSILLCATAACQPAPTEVVTVVPDYCVLAAPIVLRDYNPAVAPQLGPDRWPSSSILTERDLRTVAAHNLLYAKRCPPDQEKTEDGD